MATTSLAAVAAPGPRRMQVTLAILPKRGLSPADCQRLADRLAMAMKELTATEDCQGMPSAIGDLIAGEPPKTLVLRAMALYRQLKRTFGERQERVAPSNVAAECKRRFADSSMAELIDVPAVFIRLLREPDESDDAMSAYVQAMLPKQLVDEVWVVRLSHTRAARTGDRLEGRT